MKTLLALMVISLIVLTGVSSCASAAPQQTSAAPAASTSTQAPKVTTEAVAAIVNNQTISLETLNQKVSSNLEAKRSLGEPMPADMNSYRIFILDGMIQQMLIEQAAAIQGIKVTDADIDAEIQTDIDLVGGKDKWKAQLDREKMTETENRSALRATLITLKMRDIVTSSIGPNAEQIHARHILVPDENTAKDLLTKIKSGADFAQLAAKYSMDVTTRQTGGDLGWFSRGQLLQKAVEDSAYALAVNQISGPVKSELGYHIIQTLERVKDRPIDPQTRAKLAEEAFERWIQSLEKGAHIEKFPNGRS